MSAQKIRIRIVPDVIDKGSGAAKQYTFSITMENNSVSEGRTFRSFMEVESFLVGLQVAAKVVAGVDLFVPTVSSVDTTTAITEMSPRVAQTPAMGNDDADVSFSPS